MPELSRFYGIVVFMNYNDHSPPHFHARYGGHEVTVELASGLVTGSMPRRALEQNWQRARDRRPLLSIPPLD